MKKNGRMGEWENGRRGERDTCKLAPRNMQHAPLKLLIILHDLPRNKLK
jgi:hypothetical protein